MNFQKCLKQNGNILFLILIAVALFAALSYTVTTSSRSQSKPLDDDKIKLAVSQILQYVSQVNTAITRLTVINKCGESEIDFENPDYPTATANPRAPADGRCDLHGPNGGGLPHLKIDPDWLLNKDDYAANSFVTLHGHYGYHGTRNVVNSSTIAAEMVIVIPFLKDELCTALNKKFGITGTTDYGYWMSEYLGPKNFRNTDVSNQKNYMAECQNGSIGNSRPPNSFMYVLKDR